MKIFLKLHKYISGAKNITEINPSDFDEGEDFEVGDHFIHAKVGDSVWQNDVLFMITDKEFDIDEDFLWFSCFEKSVLSKNNLHYERWSDGMNRQNIDHHFQDLKLVLKRIEALLQGKRPGY